MATQNPIESEGTYPLPEAQVDRFLMKILVDYPSVGEEAAVVGRSLGDPADVRECLSLEDLRRHARTAQTVLVDREIDRLRGRAGRRDPASRPSTASTTSPSLIEFGASPRGPIGLVQAARVLALLRGRGHVELQDIRDLAPDVLRHRIVLSYDALSEGVTADRAARAGAGGGPEPPGASSADAPRRSPRAAAGRADERVTAGAARTPGRPAGPRPAAAPLIEALDVAVNRLVARTLPGDRRAAGVGLGTELAQLRPYEIGDDVRHIDAAATARTAARPHVRLHVPERALTTWIVLDVSPSMAFGTARRLKADVGRGRGAGVRAPGGAPGRQRRAGRVRRRAPARARRRAAPSRGWSRCAGCWPRASPPTDARTPRPWPTRCARVGRLAAPAGSGRGDLRLPRSAGLGAAARVAAGPPLGAGGRDRSIPARPSCPRSGHLALVDPETGARIEVDTSRRRRARALRRARARAPRRWSPRELRRLRVNHVTLSTDDDWLVELGRHLR